MCLLASMRLKMLASLKLAPPNDYFCIIYIFPEVFYVRYSMRELYAQLASLLYQKLAVNDRFVG